ncbi:MAG: hypothetical protein ACOYOM_07410 [Chloroflexota bacterium]
MASVIRDVVLWLAMVLVIGIRVLFLDGCNLGVTHAFDLVAVGQVRMVSGGHVVVVLIGGSSLGVLMGCGFEVMSGLAMMVGGLQVELVLFLGSHWFTPE